MFKWIILIKKRRDIGLDKFIDYYENKHVPLIRELLPPMAEFRRNYLMRDDEISSTGIREAAPSADFDVMTEGVFESREDAINFLSVARAPAVRARIRADEEQFVEAGGVAMYVVRIHQ